MQIAFTPIVAEAYTLFQEGVLALGRAEHHGIRVDVEYCHRQKEHLTRRYTRLLEKLGNDPFVKQWKKVYGAKFNINSDHQLAHLLYKVLKIEPSKTTEKGDVGSTDEETLLALELPVLSGIIELRKIRKLRDTYLDAFVREQVDGVVHPFFNLHLVKTYRSSSDSPNFQNIPKRDETSMRLCRSALFPRKGHQIFAVDFSGVEVRVSCCYTQDPKLIHDTVHGDMHKDMAIELYMLDGLDKSHHGEKNLRQGGKNGFVFPEFYGDYYGNCAPNLLRWAKIAELKNGTPALVHLSDKKLIKLDKNMNIVNSEKFFDHVRKVEDDFWNVRYKVYTKWKLKWWSNYQKKGYFDLLTGFRCQGVMTKNEVINAPFQGSAFHCLLWSFIELDKISYEKENWDSRLFGQIHDEFLIDTASDELAHVAKTCARVTQQDLAEHWKWIIVPMEVEADLGEVNAPLSQKSSYKFPS